MFEEGQLYAPVTEDADGVKVHLADDHPGANDPDYRRRRNEIAAAALAWNPGQPIPHVEYTESEHDIWRTVSRELAPKHERLAIRAFREAKAALALPEDHVPQLDEVSASLKPLTGFEFHPAAGLVPWTSSTARSPIACSTRRSTCAIRAARSTRPSRTSSTR